MIQMWSNWQDVPEGIIYRSATVESEWKWVNRGGGRRTSNCDCIGWFSSALNDARMAELAPFVRVGLSDD